MSAGQEWTPHVRRVEADDSQRIQHAVSLMREDQFDAARDELLEILNENDKSTQARILLGAVYLKQQAHTDALEQFKYVIGIDALMSQPHVMAGVCYLRMGDVEQARAELQTGLDLDPKQANGHVGMAQVLAQTGRPDQAIAHLEEAIRLDPQMHSARMLLARLLSETGNVDAAIEELTNLVHTNPEHIGASLQLAKMQRQKGNDEEAIELLEAVTKGNPDSARIWDLLGRMKMAVKDPEGAETAFTQAIALNTSDRATPFRLIDALIKQGKLDQARDALQNMPRRGRMKSVVQRFYGDIYVARHLYNEAVESYRASILNTPDGEAIMAEIEAAAGPGAASETMIPHFRAAFEKLREERRQAEAEEPLGATVETLQVSVRSVAL